MNSRIEKRFNLIFFSLILLFFVTRLGLILTASQTVLDPEEYYRGTIAKEILSGLKMPLWDYQADEYSGGSVAVGMSAVPFFKILGPSLFALKCVPLLVSFLVFLFSILFLKKYFGAGAAVAGGLALLFSPPAFTRLSLVAMGYHPESILFSVIVLSFFYPLLYEPPPDRKNDILAGFFSGLGIWAAPISAISVLSCLAAWIFQSSESFRRKWKLFFFAFVTGFLPWIFYNLTHRGSGLYILKVMWLAARDYEGGGLGAGIWKGAQLVARVFPLSFNFQKMGGFSGLFFSYFYTGLLLFLILPLLRDFQRFRTSRILPLMIYPVLFFGFAWASGMGTDISSSTPFLEFRYFVPLQFFLLFLVGASNPLRGKGKIVFFALLCLGIAGQSNLYFKEPFARSLRYKGYAYAPLARLTGQTWPRFYSSFEDYWKSIRRYDEADRLYVYGNSAYGLQFEKKPDDPAKIRKLFSETPEISKRHLTEGVGYAIGVQKGLVFDSLSQVLKEIPPDLTPYFFTGMIIGDSANRAEPLSVYLEFSKKIPPDARPYFFSILGQIYSSIPDPGNEQMRQISLVAAEEGMKGFYWGIGQKVANIWLLDGVTWDQAMSASTLKIPPQYEIDFEQGVGWGIRERISEDKIRALDWINDLPESVRAQALLGLKSFDHWWGGG